MTFSQKVNGSDEKNIQFFGVQPKSRDSSREKKQSVNKRSMSIKKP